MDTVICVVVPQSTEGEVAPLAPALLSVTDINGMSLKGSSKYIEHLLFMFALTSEDMVNCIMQSLSIFIFLRVAFLQFVTLLVTSLFSTLNKFSTVENLYSSYSLKDWNILEFSNKQVFLSLRKRVQYSENKYIYELPFKISNARILVSSEDIINQVLFSAVILNNSVVTKRWPDTIATGNNVLNIIIMAQKE